MAGTRIKDQILEQKMSLVFFDLGNYKGFRSSVPGTSGRDHFVVWLLSHVQLFATSWTIACQAPLSVGFSRQGYWSGFPCPPPGDLPKPRIKPRSSGSLSIEPPGEPNLQPRPLPNPHSRTCHYPLSFPRSYLCWMISLQKARV